MNYTYIPNEIKRLLDNELRSIDNNNDKEILKVLLNKQYEICSTVFNELQSNGRKIEHWAWYIFPTWREGQRDNLNTYLTTNLHDGESLPEVLLGLFALVL
jgi:uncharacterized protein (DUF1810 family)